MDLSGVAKALIALGVVVVIVGVVLLLFPRMPGNFSFSRGNVRVFVPLGASIVASIVLTVVLNLLFRR